MIQHPPVFMSEKISKELLYFRNEYIVFAVVVDISNDNVDDDDNDDDNDGNSV